MSKRTIKYKQTPEGERLEAVIIKYFVKQRILAERLNIIPTDLSGYVTGKNVMTKNFAQKLQNEAGISADYILNGNEPMMLEEALATMPQPRFDGIVPLRLGRKSSHGYTKHYAISGNSNRAEIKDKGDVNVASLVLGNDDDTHPVIYELTNNDYRQSCEYFTKDVYFVVDEKAALVEGDRIIVKKGHSIMLCEYSKKNARILIGKMEGQIITLDESTETLGLVLRVIVDM